MKTMTSLTVAALLALAAPLAAETDPALEAFVAKLPPDLLREIRNSDAQNWQQAAISQLFTLSPDGVLTKESVELNHQLDLARLRAAELVQLLSYDLDGDFMLSRAEYERVSPLLNTQMKAQLALLFAEGGGRDVLTMADMVASMPERARKHRNLMGERLLALDYNGDGKVDVTEFLLVLAAIPAVEEPAPGMKPKAKPEPEAARPATCNIPALGPIDDWALVSGLDADAISTVALDGQGDTTFATRIFVEEGDRPLYIFATARQPMVWEVIGDKSRIARLVVQQPEAGDGPRAAVAGVAPELVHFVPAGACLPEAPTRMGQPLNNAAELLRAKLGKAPLSLVTESSLADLVLPSGGAGKMDASARARTAYSIGRTFRLGEQSYLLNHAGMVLLDENGQPAEPAPAEALRDGLAIQDMIRTYPGGVRDFDPQTLVAPEGKIAKYELLPGQAGLLQLMAEGRVVSLGDGKYEVVAPIPALPKLRGEIRDAFTFAEGVPRPAD